ncbi:MAG: CDP-glucose 4,6-dehydratase [Candidatus Methanoperedens sp.]|nr:CDP-glucose 4,6-dehydratase [Candidatus Methanoperedens sp.]MCZ7394912.1 CDP-glucose 4,6-dehydratase [Candidatus Methanoperedens sp.]
MQTKNLSLFGDIYSNKKVLITGNTGFKGSWLSIWVSMLGADVYGLSNGIPTTPSHFTAAGLKDKITYYEKDIRTLQDVRQIIEEVKPDFVFHLAAQPLVRLSYSNPALTIETNVIGTMNILEALRQLDHPCCAVMITSDKCYDNVEWIWGYRETDSLGGKDPYSASKGAAELVVRTYANSFFNRPESKVKVASVRAGNVIGGGDWAMHRIVPDCMRAWSQGEPVKVRNLNATRPWQHVLEPLSGYLRVGQKLSEDPGLNGEPFNFGPPADQNYTVGELIAQMQESWQGGVDVLQPGRDEKEATLLKLCCDKALHMLGWKANMNFQETVKFTVDWYKTYYEQKEDVFNMTCDQIEEYVKMAKDRKLIWVSGND